MRISLVQASLGDKFEGKEGEQKRRGRGTASCWACDDAGVGETCRVLGKRGWRRAVEPRRGFDLGERPMEASRSAVKQGLTWRGAT